MLTRPPADADRKRELRKARKKRRVERVAAGLACCLVEYDGVMLQLLITTHWLKENEASDPKKIGEAVAAMWRDAGK